MSTTGKTGLLNILSYLAVVAVGIALLMSWLLNLVGVTAQIVNAFNPLAQVLAYFVVACHSYGYAKARGKGWLIVWIVAIVLIVVFLVLGNINIRFK